MVPRGRRLSAPGIIPQPCVRRFSHPPPSRRLHYIRNSHRQPIAPSVRASARIVSCGRQASGSSASGVIVSFRRPILLGLTRLPYSRKTLGPPIPRIFNLSDRGLLVDTSDGISVCPLGLRYYDPPYSSSVTRSHSRGVRQGLQIFGGLAPPTPINRSCCGVAGPRVFGYQLQKTSSTIDL